MKYKRIDENTLAIYVSERDIHDNDLNIGQLFTADQKAAHDMIYNLLKKVDPDGEFFDGGQLSIQMMPKDKGLVINVQKIDFDDNADEAELAKLASDQNIKILEDMKSLMKVIDDLVTEQDIEDKKQEEQKIAYILGKTKNLDDIIQLASLGIRWHTDKQSVYYKNGVYYVLFRYPRGMADNIVNFDFMAAAEWLQFEVDSFDKVLAGAELVIEDKDGYTAMEQLQQGFSSL